MENNINTTHHQKLSSSGDSFSFPSTPTPDSADFEFGSLNPDSPSAESLVGVSPADHLFLNGRLQPHYFPLPTSRTGSTRDSLLSSRSNSTNSSCSSARTSSSDNSDRKTFHNNLKGSGSLRAKTTTPSHYGFSQRWQYITPVPAALSRNGSARRRRDTKKGKKNTQRNNKKDNNDKNSNTKKKNKKEKKVRLRFGRRILRWFVMACRECHAMEPSSKARSNKDM